METSIITIVLQLIAVGLKAYGAKADTLANFQTLIEKSADEGLISADAKNIFLQQKADILKEIANEKNSPITV